MKFPQRHPINLWLMGTKPRGSRRKGCGRTSNYWCAIFMSGENLFFLHQIIIYAFLYRRAVRRRFAPIDAYDTPVFASLMRDLHLLHLFAVDQEAFFLLYGLFQVTNTFQAILRFRTKFQQCNFFSENGWKMPPIRSLPDTTATKGWRNSWGTHSSTFLLPGSPARVGSECVTGSKAPTSPGPCRTTALKCTIRWLMVLHLFFLALYVLRYGTKNSKPP